MELILLHWSCRGRTAQWAETKQFFLSNKSVIIVLQETSFYSDNNYRLILPGYTLYKCNYNGHSCRQGVALYIANRITQNAITMPYFEEISEHTTARPTCKRCDNDRPGRRQGGEALIYST